jgi:hypothetical protein
MSTKVFRWSTAIRTCAVSALALALAFALVTPPGPARAATSAPGTTLTCFAIDVSGSNLVASDGEPASDPGPVFVRQQVVQLYAQVLAVLGEASSQQVGVVTFGTGVGTRIGPVALADPAARSRLAAALPGALRPLAAEQAWTSWVAGIQGCRQMFQRSGARHGMVIMLTDGFPQGPAGGPGRQLSAISPSARSLWSEGISIQAVLYGAAADEPGPASASMDRLAAMGHGQLTLAATPLAMLRAALHLASVATGVPLGGAEAPVNGATSVPMTVPAHLAQAVLVVLRNSGQVQVSATAPGGQVLASLRAGTPGLALVVPVTQPAAGSYQAGAQGQGSVYAAELLRLHPVLPPSPSGRASALGTAALGTAAHRTAAHRTAAHRTVPGRAGASGAGLPWWLIAGLALLAAMTVLVLSRLIAARRRPRGVVAVWWGTHSRLVDPADIDGSADLAGLLPGGSTGWQLHWSGRAPVLTGPDGSLTRLLPDTTRHVPVTPAASVTWLPDGADTALDDELPGRPPGPASAEPVHTPDRS